MILKDYKNIQMRNLWREVEKQYNGRWEYLWQRGKKRLWWVGDIWTELTEESNYEHNYECPLHSENVWSPDLREEGADVFDVCDKYQAWLSTCRKVRKRKVGNDVKETGRAWVMRGHEGCEGIDLYEWKNFRDMKFGIFLRTSCGNQKHGIPCASILIN